MKSGMLSTSERNTLRSYSSEASCPFTCTIRFLKINVSSTVSEVIENMTMNMVSHSVCRAVSALPSIAGMNFASSSDTAIVTNHIAPVVRYGHFTIHPDNVLRVIKTKLAGGNWGQCSTHHGCG